MNLLPTILQALGIAVISVGVSLFYLPAGLVIAGAGILLFGLAWERKNK
jgi:glucose dehydrogenase